MQYDQVGKFVDPRQESLSFGEVDVGFVEHHHAVEAAQQLFNLPVGECVSRGVVGRAEPQQFGAPVGRRQQRLDRKREIGSQRHFAQFDAVGLRRHAVHAVGRRDRNGVVAARLAEDPEREVYGFVAAVAEEYLSAPHALQRGQLRLQLPLVRVGVAVHAVVVGAFVGVEPDADPAARIFVAGRGVGLQRQNVGPHELRQRFHRAPPSVRMRTALACASSPSASAMAVIVGARASSPPRVSS